MKEINYKRDLIKNGVAINFYLPMEDYVVLKSLINERCSMAHACRTIIKSYLEEYK